MGHVHVFSDCAEGSCDLHFACSQIFHIISCMVWVDDHRCNLIMCCLCWVLVPLMCTPLPRRSEGTFPVHRLYIDVIALFFGCLMPSRFCIPVSGHVYRRVYS